jgi:hypothetical protein
MLAKQSSKVEHGLKRNGEDGTSPPSTDVVDLMRGITPQPAVQPRRFPAAAATE